MVWMVCLENTAKPHQKGKKRACLKSWQNPGPQGKTDVKKKLQVKKLVYFFRAKLWAGLFGYPNLAIQPGAGVWVQLRIASLKEI